MRRRIAGLGVLARVFMVEPVPMADLVEAAREADIGVVPYTACTPCNAYALPNKLFEYLMAGLAVVAPRLPGLTPLVEGERVGLTFEPGRADSLAAVLEQLASDGRLLAELRQRARQAALDRYNAPEQARELVAAWGL